MYSQKSEIRHFLGKWTAMQFGPLENLAARSLPFLFTVSHLRGALKIPVIQYQFARQRRPLISVSPN